jgi:hypothetical protein
MLDYAAMMQAPHLLDHIRWLERELARLGVGIRLETEAPAEALSGARGRVLLATGAETVLPPEARDLKLPALTDVEILRGADPAGARAIVVYDAEGRQRGATIAASLAERTGARVSFFFPNDAPCEHLEPPNRPAIFRRLAAARVEIRPHHGLAVAAGGTLGFRDAWSDEIVAPEADLAIFAGYRQVVAPPGDAPRIGDCRAPRMLRNAVSEATKAAIGL